MLMLTVTTCIKFFVFKLKQTFNSCQRLKNIFVLSCWNNAVEEQKWWLIENKKIKQYFKSTLLRGDKNYKLKKMARWKQKHFNYTFNYSKDFLNKKDKVKLVKASVPVTGAKRQLSPDVFPIWHQPKQSHSRCCQQPHSPFRGCKQLALSSRFWHQNGICRPLFWAYLAQAERASCQAQA